MTWHKCLDILQHYCSTKLILLATSNPTLPSASITVLVLPQKHLLCRDGNATILQNSGVCHLFGHSPATNTSLRRRTRQLWLLHRWSAHHTVSTLSIADGECAACGATGTARGDPQGSVEGVVLSCRQRMQVSVNFLV